MTLDEAIIHARQIADSYKETVPDCDCAKEHRQLAEWLEELKQLREEIPRCSTCHYWNGDLKYCMRLSTFMDIDDYCSDHVDRYEGT